VTIIGNPPGLLGGLLPAASEQLRRGQDRMQEHAAQLRKALHLGHLVPCPPCPPPPHPVEIEDAARRIARQGVPIDGRPLRGFPDVTRPPVEKYVRVTIECYGFTFEPAVEWREGGHSFESWTRFLEECVRGTRISNLDDAMSAATKIGDCIRRSCPDRAYFVEVWHGEKKGFAQIYQPFGVPRSAP
jgi:hypothetical protein